MKINVCIPLGGHESRLRGVWDLPKCLIPVEGEALILKLLRRVFLLDVEGCTLCIAKKGGGMVSWYRDNVEVLAGINQDGKKGRLSLIVEPEPLGTAGAVRNAVVSTMEKRDLPLLVLNGDTLPLFDLSGMLDVHEMHLDCWATAAFSRHPTSPWRSVYAGASILSPAAVAEILADNRTYDFPAHLLGALRYSVPGFIDVGTPEGLKQAQKAIA